jgi:ribosome biogenesis protein SSF1/2
MTSKNKKLAPRQYVKKKLEKQRKRKQKEERDVEITTVPRSIVLNRGKQTPQSLKQLVYDFRKVMLPYTALKLQASKGNKLKTIIDFAGEIYVTHLVVFNSNIKNTKFK